MHFVLQGFFVLVKVGSRVLLLSSLSCFAWVLLAGLVCFGGGTMTIGVVSSRGSLVVFIFVSVHVLATYCCEPLGQFHAHIVRKPTSAKSYHIIYPRFIWLERKIHIEVWLEELCLDLVRAGNKQAVQTPESSLYSNLWQRVSDRLQKLKIVAHLSRKMERELAHERLAEKCQVTLPVRTRRRWKRGFVGSGCGRECL